jgi:hypothetical protein
VGLQVRQGEGDALDETVDVLGEEEFVGVETALE